MSPPTLTAGLVQKLSRLVAQVEMTVNVPATAAPGMLKKTCRVPPIAAAGESLAGTQVPIEDEQRCP
jgi:hypothetical protein